jgi:hypothetical protein
MISVELVIALAQDAVRVAGKISATALCKEMAQRGVRCMRGPVWRRCPAQGAVERVCEIIRQHGREYRGDLVVVTAGRTHWIVEREGAVHRQLRARREVCCG